MKTPFPARCLAGCLLLAALVFVTTGCGKTEKPTASVSGTIKYNGKPLTVGYVNFLSPSGSGGQSPLDENGGYKIDGPLDVGEYRVYLQAPIPGQNPPGTKPAQAIKYHVTPKFQDPASSGVRIALQAGPNEVPLDLKD